MDMDDENKKVLMRRNWSWKTPGGREEGGKGIGEPSDLRGKPEANYSQEGQLETIA